MMSPQGLRLAIVSTLSLMAVCGCAPRVKLSRSDRAAIQRVAVTRSTYYPKAEQVFYYTLGQNLAGAFGGVVGAVIANGAADDDRRAFAQLLQTHQIDVGKIMAERFEGRLVADK